MGKTLLTVEETAEFLLVSKSTVYRYAQKGEIPCIKKKFGYRFREDDLTKWVERDRYCPVFFPPIMPDAKLTHFLYRSGGVISEMAKSRSKARLSYPGGHIYPRKTKTGITRWSIDYYGPDHRRIQKVVKNAQTREEAALALQQAVTQSFDRELGIKRNFDKVSFSEFAKLYLESYARINKKSWKTDASYLKSMNHTFGDLYLDEVTPLHVESYKANRLKQGCSPSTVNRCLAILRKMLNLAAEWGYLDKSQVPKLKLFPENDNLKERILLDDEEAKLLGTSSPLLRSILVVALNTGMRRGEILGLRWCQIDLGSKRIRVERTKSGKVRYIEINDTLLQEFLRLKAIGGQDEYIFFNPQTGRSLRSVKTSFSAACRRAGIHDLRFHDLRHTFASRLVQLGADPITIKELLGHSSIKITERYTHSNLELKKKAVRLLDEKSAEKPENRGNLLHICDTADKAQDTSAVSSSFSVH